MRNDDYLMAAIDELGGELVDVAFNAAGLGKEEVADHGDVVRHLERPEFGCLNNKHIMSPRNTQDIQKVIPMFGEK
jgi:hypothetical protein